MKTICILTFGTSDVQFTEEEVKKHGEIFEDEKNRKKITINQVALNIKSNRDYPGIFLLVFLSGQTLLHPSHSDSQPFFYPVHRYDWCMKKLKK